MPYQSTPRTPERTPERTSALMRAASTAWSDVRDALSEGQRSPSGRFGDARTQRLLRAAMRGKPDFVLLRHPQEGGAVALGPFDMSPGALAGIGEDPTPTTTTAQQESELWGRAATLLRQLREITAAARQGARTGATEAARDIAAMTEGGIQAIVRPLGEAIGAATAPLASGVGGGIGIGLVLLGGLYVMTNKKGG